MMCSKPIFAFLGVLIALPLAAADEKSRASVPFDLQAFIDHKLEAGEKRIVVPPGRYRVTPQKRMHLKLQGLEGIEIVADGVEMVCTQTTRAVTIDGCHDFKLSGLTIDYDPLPFTQGEIVAISDDKLVHDIRLHDGYPHEGVITGKKYEIYHSDTGELVFGSYFGCEVERLAADRLCVTKAKRWMGKGDEQVGDLIVVACTNTKRGSIPHALSVTGSTGVTLESVTIYSSPMFGFIESDCSGTTYRHCVVDRRPAKGDLKVRESARLRSLNADAFHSYNAEVGPAYLNCRAGYQGDDCVAINGEYHMVMGGEGDTLRVVARRRFTMQVGDTAELVSYEGARLPDAKVVSVDPAGEVTAEERAFLQKQKLHAGFKTGMREVVTVTLDRALDLPMGSLIASSNRIGNGFRIIDGDFGPTRSRGLLIQSGRGEIRGNTITGCHGEGVKVEPEYWWLAAGSSKDLVIRYNHISNGRKPAIKVSARGGNGKLAPAGAHSEIAILDNLIEQQALPALYLTSINGLQVRGNTLRVPASAAADRGQVIHQAQCEGSVIDENVIESLNKSSTEATP